MHRHGIILKSGREIELMRAAGRVVCTVLQRMRELAAPGVTTAELNVIAEEIIDSAGGVALFKGVENPQAKFPFPAALCTSVNEELVHGIPSDRELKDGDIVSIDCGVRLAGYCGDSATTIPIGGISDETEHLLDVTKKSLELAIDAIKPGRMWSEVASQMQANADFELQSGMVVAIEPMVNVGSHLVDYGSEDRWVVVTRDRKYAAHFEHTIAVVDSGADVLTDGRRPS